METAVSFVLINYQTPLLTTQCIQSIEKHTHGLMYEIIVVDNGSADDSVSILTKIPAVKLISSPENLGFGKGNNLGASHATGKYLFFINTDAYLLNNAALLFYEYMEQYPQAACCGGELLTADLQKQVSYGNFPTVSEAFSQLGFYRLYPRYFHNRLAIAIKNEADDVRQVDYISGAGLFVRTTVFKRLHGFDPAFFLYFEETEFAWRVRQAGYRSVLIPQARMVHLEGGSYGEPIPYNYQKLEVFTKSRYLFFKKTRSAFIAYVVNLLLAAQALLLWIIKRKTHYLKVFRIIVQSSS